MPRTAATVVLHMIVPPQSPVRLVTKLRGALQRRLPKPGRAPKPCRLGDALDVAPPSITTALPATARRVTLPVEALEAITAADCDAVLNLSDRDIAGPDPEVVRHGLWERRVGIAGGQSLTWPVTALTPVLIELCLVRVGSASTDDTVLQRGWVASAPRSLAATIDTAGAAMRDWLTRTCMETLARRATPVRDGAPPARTRIFEAAALPAVLSSPVRTLLWAVRQLFRQEEWSVGIVDVPIETVYERGHLGRPRWLRNPSSRCYLADPFGVPGSDTILAESYDYLRRRGDIVAVHADGSGRRTSTVQIIRSDGHASYPYLFECDGETYCVPETSDQRQATLFRAIDPCRTWQRVATLVDDMAVVDPTIVRHAGRWWMFCTDGDGGECSNLHVYHTRDLTGPWQSHPLNPVKVDVRSARGAGTPFIVDGALIRPAQDNERGYGTAVVFNQIEQLTPDTYEERTVRRIEPQRQGRYRSGFHTISAWGDRTLVDGKHKGLSAVILTGRLLTMIRGRSRTAARVGRFLRHTQDAAM